MSIQEYHQEVARHAASEDAAILCDALDTKLRISATLLQHKLASTQTQREPLLFVVQDDVHVVQHQAWLGHAHIQSAVVRASTAPAMTRDMWAAIILQTQVVITSGQALLSMLQNNVLRMSEAALVVLDFSREMMQGDPYHQLIEGHLRAHMIRPRLIAFANPTEPSLEYLLTATRIRTMTASIDASANQVCRFIRCAGFMGAEESMDTACSRLVALCSGNELFTTALKSYEYAWAHLGSWCSVHIWTFALQACREEVAHHPQSVSLLRLLERAEQVARNLELEFTLPTWKSVSEKLWRLVALLRSPQNGLIHSAVVLVSSDPSALVITKFLEQVSSLGHNVGMQGARVSSLISSNRSVALQTTVDGFKSGLSNILVASGTTRGLPLNLCYQVVQFDVANLWNVADLAHYYMVVRICHHLADYLGGVFLKTIICTDVFVTNLNGTPGNLTDDIGRVYRSITNSTRQKTSFGMAYIADGPVGALRSLVQTYTQIPAAEQWVDFVARYKETVLNQQALHLNAPSAAVATIQSTIGYTFSDEQVLVDALSKGTCACERLEFVGDAALDLVAAMHWVAEYPTTPASKLAQIKSASVCNNFLAMVFIELGLHQCIQRGSQFHNSIAKVLPSHTAMLAATPTGDFWMEVDYAKSIADVMEAVLGAVYIDSEFDIGAVPANRLRRVFSRQVEPDLLTPQLHFRS
ncbi:MAG: hypothetical protein J3Q66DRAFT_368738 [Benniella sp.]|nr:MAG: hypothetical protein J3Q66DRAFT_368738 [Benniella sp.]